jgi:hypothetical protein
MPRTTPPPPLDEQLTAQALLQSLRSTTCPVCGGPKKSMHSLCLSDYRRLPKPMRDALWALIGDGYKEAMADALVYLHRTLFRMPEA